MIAEAVLMQEGALCTSAALLPAAIVALLGCRTARPSRSRLSTAAHLSARFGHSAISSAGAPFESQGQRRGRTAVGPRGEPSDVEQPAGLAAGQRQQAGLSTGQHR